MVKLGVNIDHVATLRNARGGAEPDPITAALVSEVNGADGITAHLREDRRHIHDEDIRLLKRRIKTRLNLEMAATAEMVDIAARVKPYMATLVPERREELTTEGGLDVVRLKDQLKPAIKTLQENGILVSLFIDPRPEQVEASKEAGAEYIELHTGEYANAFGRDDTATEKHLRDLVEAGALCGQIGLLVNAGHGLNYENVKPVLDIPGLVELNIGHSIISRAVFMGIGSAVSEMKHLISDHAKMVAPH